MRLINEYSLYLVISEEYCSGRDPMAIAEQAIAGGVDIIQMRGKNKPRNDLVALGKRLAKLCRAKDVLFIVNDDPLLARLVGADGVHLGQDDLIAFSIEKARNTIGPDRIIGISTNSLKQFEKANNEDADYIAFGPVFQTAAKNYCIGTGSVKAVLESARRPVFFIGGINFETLPTILVEGAKNIALIRGITQADDITAATRRFKSELSRQKETVGA
jgi:thiamine-phosphate pyrophosphorylase